MPRGRFVALLALVTTAITATLLLAAAAVRDDRPALVAATVATGLVAIVGFAVLMRVVIVIERSRRRR